jgi:hypothetical protein
LWDYVPRNNCLCGVVCRLRRHTTPHRQRKGCAAGACLRRNVATPSRYWKGKEDCLLWYGTIVIGYCVPSTGVTCFVCCLRTAKNARCCVPQLYRRVYCFFDEVEKTIYPTRMGSVREPGSLTHPQVSPVEIVRPMIRSACLKGTFL